MEDYSSNYGFKAFARSKGEFLRIVKKSEAKKFIKRFGYSLKNIPEDAISVDKGREGNWNNYVREFEGIKPKKGENYYEYYLRVWKLKRVHNPNLKKDEKIKAKTKRKFSQPTWRGDLEGERI